MRKPILIIKLGTHSIHTDSKNSTQTYNELQKDYHVIVVRDDTLKGIVFELLSAKGVKTNIFKLFCKLFKLNRNETRN